MKPPRDDETNLDQLVARAIMGPEFQASWETLNGSGIGSTEATSHVSNLIRRSRWHLERLHIQHEALMEAIQKFSAAQLNQATFECQLLGAFFCGWVQLYGQGGHAGRDRRRQAARPPRGRSGGRRKAAGQLSGSQTDQRMV
jgi:hypothetical protein